MNDAPPPKLAALRGLRIALLISLGINLAVAGLLGGLILNGPSHGPRGEVGLWRYGAVLPEPFRRDLARDLRDSWPQWDGPRRGLRAQSAALAAAQVAESYDQAAVARLLAFERELLGTLVHRGTALLLVQIERMNPDERADYADARTRRGDGSPRPTVPGPARERRMTSTGSVAEICLFAAICVDGQVSRHRNRPGPATSPGSTRSAASTGARRGVRRPRRRT